MEPMASWYFSRHFCFSRLTGAIDRGVRMGAESTDHTAELLLFRRHFASYCRRRNHAQQPFYSPRRFERRELWLSAVYRQALLLSASFLPPLRGARSDRKSIRSDGCRLGKLEGSEPARPALDMEGAPSKRVPGRG